MSVFDPWDIAKVLMSTAVVLVVVYVVIFTVTRAYYDGRCTSIKKHTKDIAKKILAMRGAAKDGKETR